MIHRLKRECIVYILIFCLNQITIAGVNPFGIALAASAIGAGYNVYLSIFATAIGNILIYDYNVMNNILILVSFAVFCFIIKKYNKKLNDTTLAMIFLIIFSAIKIGSRYQDLHFLNTLIMILETLIVTSSYLIFYVGIEYLAKKYVLKEMKMQEKISLSLIITLLGIYIIQARKENVTLLKIVIIYIFAFLGTVIYKIILDMRNNKECDKEEQKGMVYNNLVYNKMQEYADMIMKMSKSISMIRGNEDINKEQESSIFEKVSEKYCAACEKCSYCWDKEFNKSYEVANALMKKGVENGVLTMDDLPPKFVVRCRNSEGIISETNINLELARNNIWWQDKVDEMRRIMTMQLADLSNSISDFTTNMYRNVKINNKIYKKVRQALKYMGIQVRNIACFQHKGVKELIIDLKSSGRSIKSLDIAAGISEVLGEKYKLGEFAPRVIGKKITEINLIREEEFSIRTASISIKKDGENCSGDNYSIIESDVAETVLAISDGMGSGRAAYEESKKTIEMVEEFLEVGFNKDIAMNLVNLASYMSYEKNEMYSTLDVCVVNRYSGIGEFIKMGAAVSYIKRGREVIEISSETLPLGVFNSAEYERKQIELLDGDVIIMVTDGLIDSISKYVDWKEEMIYIIKNIESCNPKTIVDTLVKEVLSDKEITDDITILVGVIWNNLTAQLD